MLAQCPSKRSSLPAGGHRCQVVAYVCRGDICPKHQRALTVPTPIPCHAHQPHSHQRVWRCPGAAGSGIRRRQALETRHCQMNRPRHIEHVMEPRPPKAQPNGLLERKSETQIISTQRALQGVCAPESTMGMSTVPFLCHSATVRTSRWEGKTFVSVHVWPL